jgi:hypothetical protein
MARWVLECQECRKDFTHSEVLTDSGVFAWSGIKPEFPDGGLTVICPNCNTSGLYQRRQLAYRTS